MMMNVHPVKPAEIELVLTLAALTIHAVPVLNAQYTTTELTVIVHLDLQEIHIADVSLVRNNYISLESYGFLKL